MGFTAELILELRVCVHQGGPQSGVGKKLRGPRHQHLINNPADVVSDVGKLNPSELSGCHTSFALG